jgi:hypothetical protein
MKFAAAKSGFCNIQLPGARGNKSGSGLGRKMIERTIYTPEADEDVAESYEWYESREPGLGEDFLRCIEACVLTVQRHPHIFRSPWTGLGALSFGASLMKFSTSRPTTVSSSTPFFTAPKTHKSGASASVTMTEAVLVRRSVLGWLV